MKRRAPKAGYDLNVGNSGLPPWDRGRGPRTDLAPRIGSHVVVGNVLATRILDFDPKSLAVFTAAGIIRDARIVERPADRLTHACVTADCDTRLHLEYGETLLDVRLGRPADWTWDADGRDYDGRVCVRIRPLAEGGADDMAIETDRRTYRLRLVRNPRKVTIACSWTYEDPVTVHATGRPLGLPGDTGPRHRHAGMGQKTRFTLMRLGPTMRMQVMAWAAGLRKVKARHLALYKTMHTRSGVPHDWKHPRSIMAAVVARARSVESFSEVELRQWLPIPEDFHAAVAAVNAFAKRGLGRERAAGDTPTVEEMATAFPVLAGLPETSLADPESFAAPPESARRIAWSMRRLAETAALFCMVAPRHLRRPVLVTETLRDLRTLERLADDAGLSVDLGDAAAVAALIEHVTTSPDCTGLTQVTRHRIARSLMTVIRTTRRHIRLHDLAGARGLGRLRPVDPRQVEGTLRRLGQFAKDLVARLRANRKERVHRHAGRVAALEFAADLNLEQVILTNRGLKAAAEALGDEDFVDAPITMTIVDGRGRLRPGKQRCVWRVWRADAYLRRLMASAAGREERARVKGHLARIAAGAELAPIYEYRRTVGILGSTPIEPFVVRCWRHGLMAPPATLPAAVRRRRLATLRELKLPGFVKSEQGLFVPGADEMDLWRISLRQHRVLAFPQAMEHGLRFAHLALSTVFENLARTTVVLQQVDDQEGYQTRRLNGQTVVGFLAHDKVAPNVHLPETMSWFPVGPKHLEEQAQLVAMTCLRCGYADGLLPETLHLIDMLWKRPDPAAWVFQFNGKPLHGGVLGRLLRFLLAGNGRITLHDFRHLLANAAYAAGVPGWMIRLALNHGTSDLWLYYAQLSVEQEGLIEASTFRAIVARSADARGQSAMAA